ncbi:MAG TPA: hypothetical protein VFA94_13620 [Acidimicrobiales bacterium]|nr:hypothetical protein [Acidimicrobiales bacterium]
MAGAGDDAGASWWQCPLPLPLPLGAVFGLAGAVVVVVGPVCAPAESGLNTVAPRAPPASIDPTTSAAIVDFFLGVIEPTVRSSPGTELGVCSAF